MKCHFKDVDVGRTFIDVFSGAIWKKTSDTTAVIDDPKFPGSDKFELTDPVTLLPKEEVEETKGICGQKNEL